MTFPCGTQDGDDNEYETVGTKRVYTMYFHVLRKLYIRDIPNKCGNKIKKFVLIITETIYRNFSE